MGNTPANAPPKTSTKPAEAPTYQLVQKVDDPHYGEIKLVRDSKTGEQIYLKEIIFSTREAFKAETNAYNKRIAVSHPNVVRILGCTATDKPNFCSGYYRISVFIEVLPKTLADELAVRIETVIPFSENDILLIAESLIAALSYFETQNICHGDIRPANIFVTRHSYKLSDPYLNVNKTANALSNAIIGEAQTLIAPQMLRNLPVQDFNVRCNKFKADVFSLGATLLSLASLEKSEELYDYETGNFDLTLMNDRLERVRKGYSKFTYDLIRSMLRINEDARPDFISLANKFLPYQEDIRRKAELPIFGVRAQYDGANDEEDYLELQKLLPRIEPKRHIQQVSETQKMSSHASPIRGSQRSGRSGLRAGPDDSRPVENIYTCNLEDEEYQYGQDNEPVEFLGGYEDSSYGYGYGGVSQSPIRDRQQDNYYQESAPMRKSNSPEKIKRAQPNIETHYQPEVQHQQYQEPPRNRVESQQNYYQAEYYVQSQAQPQKTQVQQAPTYTKSQSFSKQENRNQVSIPLTGLQSLAQKSSITTTTMPIDDLEAKIRAALQRSEATYQHASGAGTGANTSTHQNTTNAQPSYSQTTYQPATHTVDYSTSYQARPYGQESFGATPTSNLGGNSATLTSATPLSLHGGAQAKDFSGTNAIKDRNLNSYPGNISGISNIESQYAAHYDVKGGYTSNSQVDTSGRNYASYQPTYGEKPSTTPQYGYTAQSNLSNFGNYGNLEVLPSQGVNENTYSYGGTSYQYNYQPNDQGVRY